MPSCWRKCGTHLPLYRQSDLFAEQGADPDISTLADWVGACAATLAPTVKQIEKHVLAAERIHAHDFPGDGSNATGNLVPR